MGTVGDLTTHALRAAKPHEMRTRLLVSYGLMLLLLFGFLTVCRFQVFGGTDYWEGLVDKLSAAVFLALIALGWYWLIAPKSAFNEDLEVVEAWNIGPKLDAGLKGTHVYWFRGRSARWFRAKGMPRLSNAARKDGSARQINLILPDPSNDEVLQAYADHRNGLAEGAADPWTPTRIRTEILATILVAGKTAADNSRFKARVFLVPDFSVVRYDLSDTGLMMTREDKRWPGWFSGSGSRFYTSILDDLRIISERARQIDLVAPAWPKLGLSATDIPAVVAALGFSFQVSPAEARDILAAVRSDKSPYV